MPATSHTRAADHIPSFPTREAGAFTPLITAHEAFPAMERLVCSAMRSVNIAFRIFDPATRLRSTARPGETWLDLLRTKLREGVAVRVMLTDFDPIGAPGLHRATWQAVGALGALADDGPLEIMPVRHEARLGRGLRFGFWLPALGRLDRHRRALNALDAEERRAVFATQPGLWRYLHHAPSGEIRWRVPRLPRLFPATPHQKFIVADEARAVIGGLDVDERRFDDPDHSRPAPDTWHDLSVEVDGPIASDIASHFAELWNASRLRMAALRREQTGVAPPSACPMPQPARPMASPPPPGAGSRDTGLRLIRTLSRNRRRHLFRFSPRTLCREIEESTLALIARAERVLYFETQFFRSKVIADALASAASRCPGLGLILILPAAPDAIAFEDDEGLAARFGEHLQSECVEQVQQAFGSRAAILCPASQRPSASSGRDSIHDAEMIYVHAKVSLADECLAIVSSANLNGRSLRWDTEAGILCDEPDLVRRLRRDLWQHWHPGAQDRALFECSAAAHAWRERAQQDAARPPRERLGLLLPYDPAPARDIAMPAPGIPDELV